MKQSVKRQQAEKQVQDALLNGEYGRAARLVSTFEAAQPSKRGIGIEWDAKHPPFSTEVLRNMMTLRPWFIADLSDGECKHIQLAAALMELWGEGPRRFTKGVSIAAPSDYEPQWLANMVHSHVVWKAALSGWQASGEVEAVQLRSSVNDEHVCRYCKRMSGKQFSLAQVPEVPLQGCTSKLGCRCGYRPVLIDVW